MASGSQNNVSYQAQKWTNIRAFTIGATAKNIDGTANASWTATEILGSSSDAYFYRGDKTWSNLLNNNFHLRVNTARATAPDSDTAMGIYWRDTNTSTTNYVALVRHYHFKSNAHGLLLHVYNDAGTSKAFKWIIPASTATDTNPYVQWDGGRIANSIYPYSNDSYDLGATSLGWRNIYLRGSPSDSHAIDGTYPFIEFSNADRTQYARLLYTHYDNQGGQQSLAFIGNTSNTTTYIKSQCFMTNAAAKTAWNDGVEGTYIGADGTIQMTEGSTDNRGGYIGFHYNASTTATSYISGVDGAVRANSRLVVNTDTYQQLLGARDTTKSSFAFAVVGNGFIRDTIYSNVGLQIHRNAKDSCINIYHTDETSAQPYISLYIDTIGKADAQGYARLTLGNNLSYTSDLKQAKNARGRIQMYQSGSNYCWYYPESWSGNGVQSVYTFTGATNTTSGTEAFTAIYIGNNHSVDSTDAHTEAVIRMYGNLTYFHELRSGSVLKKSTNTYQAAQASADSANRYHYLPNATGYLMTINTTAAITMTAESWAKADWNAGTQYLVAANSYGYGNTTDIARIARRVYADGSSTGYSQMLLGNNIASGSAANAYGSLVLYSTGAKYTNLRSAQTTADNTMYLPNYNGTGYLAHTSDSSAVGSTLGPVYVAANGRITACTGYFTQGGTNSTQLGGFSFPVAATTHSDTASYASHRMTYQSTTKGVFLYDNTDKVTVWSWQKQTVNSNLVWKADAATTDASGNTITSYYCTLSTAQTISGAKTFTNNVYINKSTDVAMAGDSGSLVIGDKGGKNIGIDGDEIMDRNNKAASNLSLNYEGGNIVLGVNNASYYVQVRSTKAGSSKTEGALVVGGGAGFGGTVYANAFNGPLTGNVTGSCSGNSTGVSYQNNDLDFTKTNFNISSNWDRNMCWFGEKSGTGIGRLNFVAKTNGTNQISMQARRWNTSGTAVGAFAGITIISNRSNATTCTIDGATTVSGNITALGHVYSKITAIDLKSATNNVSDNTACIFQAVDKNGYGWGLFQAVAKNNGDAYVYMGVCNRNTSGTSQGWKGISITSTKAGAVTYGVTDSAAFRSAIGVKASGTHEDSYFALASHGTHVTAANVVAVLAPLFTITRANHSGDNGMIVDNTTSGSPLKIGYIVGSSGNGGIYDYTHSAWKVKIATDGTTTFTGSLSGHASSDLALTGGTLSGELDISSANCIRFTYGSIASTESSGTTNQGMLFRLDGSYFYLLAVNSDTRDNNGWYGNHPWYVGRANHHTYFYRAHNAVWNDFAEFREADITEPGRVVVDTIHGKMQLATERLQPGAKIISDTYGCSVGLSDIAKTPIGVAGRVLAYTYQDRNNYPIGAAVCAAPNGTVDIMTREEIIQYPERILGTVSEIPTYEYWENQLSNESSEMPIKNTVKIKVNNRIWIYVR